MPRKILHLDLDAFYCAVEEQLNPDLQGKPVAVGGSPDHRGVVASCSYNARQYGVRSAMPMRTAVRLCPNLIIVSRSDGDYHQASRNVMEILQNLTPSVEQLSIDEAFLDVTIHPEPGEAIAQKLQKQINTDLGLPCSLGVASNKLVAKIANNVGKASVKTNTYPNHIEVVADNMEAKFLAPLRIEELWGVGKKTAEKLHQMGVKTIGDATRWSEADLVKRFGKHGEAIFRHSRGIDNRPVETELDTKSISKEITFDKDVIDVEVLKDTLRRLSDGVGRQVRKSEITGTTIKLKLRWSDFTTLTRQVTLPYTTDQDEEIYQAALQLLYDNWNGRRVRLIGVGISGFEEAHRQLGLWDNPEQLSQNKQLQSTLDDIKDRFGDASIKRGSFLKKKPSP